MPDQRDEQVPESMRPVYEEIVALTDAFCQERLNEEYRALCRRLAAKLARKRPSPLQGGRARTWASAIAYTIANNNFAFDKTQTPHITSRELANWFGLATNTVTAKASEVRRLFRIHMMEPEWTLPSRIGQNPMVWMISVNGFLVDARYMPREIQEEALAKGLIPYIPEAHEGDG
jgi:hypothetical protein